MMATQSQFEAKLAEQLDVTKREAVMMLDTIADLLFRELRTGEPVVVRGIGRFKINARPARMGRNPQTGEQIKIKASKRLKVLPNKSLKDKLKVK
jgi:DNA-binding protein HU-beta